MLSELPARVARRADPLDAAERSQEGQRRRAARRRIATRSTCSTRRCWAPGRAGGDRRREFVAAASPSSCSRRSRKPRCTRAGSRPTRSTRRPCSQFVRAVLDPADSNAFLDDFVQLQRKVAFFGVFNSLSQTVLKLGSPGVADMYQGNELWDFSPGRSRQSPAGRLRAAQPAPALAARARRRPARAQRRAARAVATMDGSSCTSHSACCACGASDPSCSSAAAIRPLRGNPARGRVRSRGRRAGAGHRRASADRHADRAARSSRRSARRSGATTALRVPGEPGRVYRDLFTGRRADDSAEDGKAALQARRGLRATFRSPRWPQRVSARRRVCRSARRTRGPCAGR